MQVQETQETQVIQEIREVAANTNNRENINRSQREQTLWDRAEASLSSRSEEERISLLVSWMKANSNLVRTLRTLRSGDTRDKDSWPATFDCCGPPYECSVHRSAIRKDVTKIFCDPNIFSYSLHITVIDATGQREAGEGRRVLLDVLTKFWQECFYTLMIGSNEKTPSTRHFLQKAEWQAIARALVYGYIKLQYFPFKLSQLFVAYCLFGEESITQEFQLKSFQEYIAAEDREVLDRCLGNTFEPTDDVVLNFLSKYGCSKVPTKDNIQTIISELAHQELVQKPGYICNCWAPILQKALYKNCSLEGTNYFQTVERLDEFYETIRPTTEKVIKLFKANPASDAQHRSLEYLKRFINSLKGRDLGKFLHFCTGSDVLTYDSIEISFTSLQGFQRCPVARTCGPILELPSTYESYPALKEEFRNILNEDLAWSFDIV